MVGSSHLLLPVTQHLTLHGLQRPGAEPCFTIREIDVKLLRRGSTPSGSRKKGGGGGGGGSGGGSKGSPGGGGGGASGGVTFTGLSAGGANEQAARVKARQLMLAYAPHLLDASRDEIRWLKDMGVLGKRAPKCSLMAATGMLELLRANQKAQMADLIAAALDKHKASKKGRQHAQQAAAAAAAGAADGGAAAAAAADSGDSLPSYDSGMEEGAHDSDGAVPADDAGGLETGGESTEDDDQAGDDDERGDETYVERTPQRGRSRTASTSKRKGENGDSISRSATPQRQASHSRPSSHARSTLHVATTPSSTSGLGSPAKRRRSGDLAFGMSPSHSSMHTPLAYSSSRSPSSMAHAAASFASSHAMSPIMLSPRNHPPRHRANSSARDMGDLSTPSPMLSPQLLARIPPLSQASLHLNPRDGSPASRASGHVTLLTPAIRFANDHSPGIIVSPDGSTVAGPKGGQGTVRASHGISSGSWYIEVRGSLYHPQPHWDPSADSPAAAAAAAAAAGGFGGSDQDMPHCRLGFATLSSKLDQKLLGHDAHSYAYGSRFGDKIHRQCASAYGESFNVMPDPCNGSSNAGDVSAAAGYPAHSMQVHRGDVMGMLIELDVASPSTPSTPSFGSMGSSSGSSSARSSPVGSRISFFKNGVCQGTAFEDLPRGHTWYPAASLSNGIVLRFDFHVVDRGLQSASIHARHRELSLVHDHELMMLPRGAQHIGSSMHQGQGQRHDEPRVLFASSHTHPSPRQQQAQQHHTQVLPPPHSFHTPPSFWPQSATTLLPAPSSSQMLRAVTATAAAGGEGGATQAYLHASTSTAMGQMHMPHMQRAFSANQLGHPPRAQQAGSATPPQRNYQQQQQQQHYPHGGQQPHPHQHAPAPPVPRHLSAMPPLPPPMLSHMYTGDSRRSSGSSVPAYSNADSFGSASPKVQALVQQLAAIADQPIEQRQQHLEQLQHTVKQELEQYDQREAAQAHAQQAQQITQQQRMLQQHQEQQQHHQQRTHAAHTSPQPPPPHALFNAPSPYPLSQYHQYPPSSVQQQQQQLMMHSQPMLMSLSSPAPFLTPSPPQHLPMHDAARQAALLHPFSSNGDPHASVHMPRPELGHLLLPSGNSPPDVRMHAMMPSSSPSALFSAPPPQQTFKQEETDATAAAPFRAISNHGHGGGGAAMLHALPPDSSPPLSPRLSPTLPVGGQLLSAAASPAVSPLPLPYGALRHNHGSGSSTGHGMLLHSHGGLSGAPSPIPMRSMWSLEEEQAPSAGALGATHLISQSAAAALRTSTEG